MIELTYGMLRNGTFFPAFGKLYNASGIKDVRVIQNISRIQKLLDKYATEAQEIFLKLVKEYAVLDDKGEILPHDGVPNTYKIQEEKQGEWEEKVKEFTSTKVSLSAKRIHLHELVGVPLSARDLNELECLMVTLEEVT